MGKFIRNEPQENILTFFKIYLLSPELCGIVFCDNDKEAINEIKPGQRKSQREFYGTPLVVVPLSGFFFWGNKWQGVKKSTQLTISLIM